MRVTSFRKTLWQVGVELHRARKILDRPEEAHLVEMIIEQQRTIAGFLQVGEVEGRAWHNLVDRLTVVGLALYEHGHMLEETGISRRGIITASSYLEERKGRLLQVAWERVIKVTREAMGHYETTAVDGLSGAPPAGISATAQRTFARAIKEFGITNDFVEAGYLLPDGQLLDFSERNNGGGGVRSLDHGAIGRVLSGRSDERHANIIAFMRLGAMRVSCFSSSRSPLYVQFVRTPTLDQLSKLASVMPRLSEFVAEVWSPTGHPKAVDFFEQTIRPTMWEFVQWIEARAWADSAKRARRKS
jgi:hypothetical protein